MATAGEQLIKEKIESLNNLPAGYTPNLASKWEVLENGLKPEKKPLVFAWRKYLSLAASLLFIGGAGLLLIKNISTRPQLSNTIKPEIKLPIANFSVAKTPVKSSSKRIRNIHHKKTVPLHQARVPELDTTIQEPVFVEQAIVPVEAIALSEPTAAKKSKRFNEVDFNEPVIGASAPTPTFVESQRFRFKLGFGGATKNTAQQSSQPSMGLKTNF